MIVHKIQNFMNAGLLVSPWLAGVGKRSRFDDDIFEYLDGQAQSIIDMQWTEQMQTMAFGENLPIPDRIPRTALYEIAASTAVWIAHEETGTPEVTFEFADQALQRMRSYYQTHGLPALVEVYVIATRYENYQAIAYYRDMPERQFILGHLHRPWVDYSLQDELVIGVLTGNMSIRMDGERRVVSLTNQGHANLIEITAALEQSGYLDQRVRILHVSRFNSAIVLEETVHKMAPDWIPQRAAFVNWSGIEPGMRVLEIGCGDGLLTIDGGLADRIGPMGSLIAVDPSMGMLSRARLKLQESTRKWVQFMKAGAEALPFESGSFDAVVGAAFLHLTDIPKALKEVRRVTRDGGIVSAFNILPIEMDAPFFADWMAPLIDLAKQNGRKEPKNFFISAISIEQEFAKAGIRVEKTEMLASRFLYWWPRENVNVAVRGLGWAQEELATIPWAAREELIDLLEEHGEDVCRRYSQENRVLRFPMQMIRGVID